MTPEQENELVARWMGWARGGWDGDHPEFSQWSRTLNGVKSYYVGLLPYRTDPALLWELIERLISLDLEFSHSFFLGSRRFHMARPFECSKLSKDTLAEVVFAAAVMQAQEGK